MKERCCWKQWGVILFVTALLMGGKLAVGQEPNEEAELRALMEQMEAYQTQVKAEGDAGPQHPTPKERALEAQLAEMQHRAVVAEEALAACKAEVESLKSP